jgi:hypothetical protein
VTPIGPFEVEPDQITRLAAAFAQFVNQLLVRETSRAQMKGHQLNITVEENRPDGGVDAYITEAIETDWLPGGDSAWQFKRSDLAPAKCRDELLGASRAQETLRSGGSYRLALGATLNADLVVRRRNALVKELRELGIELAEGSNIEVLDANSLARWVGQFPALAVSQVLAGPGYVAVEFERWSSSPRHRSVWVPDERRRRWMTQIQSDLLNPDKLALRIQGDSGIGKTRLVMEALRETELTPLVGYVANEADLSGELVNSLVQRGRSVILVVDECSGRRHEKLYESLSSDAEVKLITIGEQDDYAIGTPFIDVSGLPDPEMAEFLRQNHRTLSPESSRVVVEHCGNNVRLADLLARRILESDPQQVAELIKATDVRQFLSVVVPEGRPFLLTSILALFERVGWERELRPEIESLLEFSGASLVEYLDLERELTRRGLLERQGRYRKLGPHPLAVVLAADIWRTDGERIISELLPVISREMALSLFGRVAQLGSFEPAQSVLSGLMGPEGPFGSLASIEERDLGEFLIRMAIVAPEQTTRHLSSLIAEASLEDLRLHTRSRRSLVWALEKLAWHSRSFVAAADALLRLALAENETYANNATGTWTVLFGVGLPATAASPEDRLTYVEERSRSQDSRVRLLVAQAGARFLLPHESITVSGELQGGTIVEPRGGIRTYQEASQYRRRLVEILDRLRGDENAEVAAAAVNGIVASLHPLISDPEVGPFLMETLPSYQGDALEAARRKLHDLRDLVERHGQDAHVTQLVVQLDESLPALDELRELRFLLDTSPWMLEEESQQANLRELLTSVIEQGQLDSVLGWVGQEELPAGWHLGHLLANSSGGDSRVRDELVAGAGINLPALAGYLRGQVEGGADDAFDVLLDGPAAATLSPEQKLAISTRGPATEDGRHRVLSLAAELPVAAAAGHLVYWRKEFAEEEMAELLASWRQRIEREVDLAAAVSFLGLWLHGEPQSPPALNEAVFEILKLRSQYPELGNESWTWSMLLQRFVESRPSEVAHLIFDLISVDHLIFTGPEEEGAALVRATMADPVRVWGEAGMRIEDGDWRLQLILRKWFVGAVPVSVLEAWIDGSVERARLVASIADPGTTEPTAVGSLLLEHFASDDELRSNLAGNFMTGGWTGPMSAHIGGQIVQLQSWLERPSEPDGVRRWANEMIEDLRRQQGEAVEREAERGF